jgi:predicted HAD superfamily Cof-like phosphohydrolase
LARNFTVYIMSQLYIIVQTCTDTPAPIFKQCLQTIDECKRYSGKYDDIERIEAQADAMVDMWYYILNCGAKHGIDLSAWVRLVYCNDMKKNGLKIPEFDIYDVTDADMVREFTEGSMGRKLPMIPVQLDTVAVMFITRMVLSELHEFVCTIARDRDESLRIMSECWDIAHAKSTPLQHVDCPILDVQCEVFAQMWNSMLKTGVIHGIDLTALFNVVHDANMAKRDPVTKQFILRPEDGKIMKPDNWKPADTLGEIKRQLANGAWK